MSRRRAAAALLGVLSASLGAASLALAAGGGLTLVRGFDILTTVSFGLAGAALAWARPRNVLGWLLLLIGFCEGLADLASAVAQHPSAEPGPVRTGSAWLASWIWFPALALLPTAVLALYPTGRAGSRSRSRLVAAASAGTALVMAGLALVDDAADDIVAGVVNPFAVPWLGLALAAGGAAVLVPCVLLSLADAARRLWRAESPEREQLGWLLVTVVLALLVSYTPWQTPRAAVYVLVPVAIAVGVVRHRLLDLQVVVRRALLFLALTLLVVGVFAGTTAALADVAGGERVPVTVAAALVAVLLTPAHDRLQRAVDRLVYGDRRDPVRVVAGLGRDLAGHDGDTLVPQVLETVRRALRSPHVALHDPAGRLLLEAGSAVAGSPYAKPLRVAGRDVGSLAVAPRTARDTWSRGDLVLIDVLAPQVAVVVHATQLYADLVESRDRALGATAAERQRLRVELHDGLGPALAGIALGLEAAEVALAREPARAAGLLARLRSETQSASREVRRLVDGLRPSALEGRDLPSALEAFLDAMRAGGGLDLQLEVPTPLPELTADVDSAVYRIATEAVTNVVRHSGAGRCTVRLEALGGTLRLQVTDDGVGLSAQHPAGVGLASMRSRAAELGGTWQVRSRPGGGTTVEVRLPVVRRVEVPA